MKNQIQKFEDLIAWRKARTLTARIYEETAKGKLAHDFGLREQIRKSAVSIMSNIAEGYERAGPSEFHRFLTIAKASCAELRSQLYVAIDVGYLGYEVFIDLLDQAEEVASLVGGLRVSTKRRKVKS
jgi:four helix bundle protein